MSVVTLALHSNDLIAAVLLSQRCCGATCAVDDLCS